MVLCKVPAGLREKKRLSRPAGTLLLCAWEEKRAVRGSGNEKPARETRKEISFGITAVRPASCDKYSRAAERYSKVLLIYQAAPFTNY